MKQGSTPGNAPVRPYFDDGDVALYVGDAREALAALEPESVDCIVTSPPYYLLRDYGGDEQVWGGERDCEHDWGAVVPGDNRGGSGAENGQRARGQRYGRDAERGTYCQRCGAWRGSLGLEPDLDGYVENLVEVFAECRRVLNPRGTLWLNLGDTHSSAPRGPRHGRTSRLTTPERQERVSPVVNKRGRHPDVKPKDLFLAPFEVARALRRDGWWLRQVVIWDKTNTVPESARDRPTSAHEYVFLLAKSRMYDYDGDAIAEPATWERWGRQTNRKHASNGRRKASYILDATIDELRVLASSMTRNARSVWRLNAAQYPDAHDAVMPNELAEKCILAGCPKGGLVLDPFAGASTTLVMAKRLGRRAIGVELSEENAELSRRRLAEWWKDPWRPPARPDDQLALDGAT